MNKTNDEVISLVIECLRDKPNHLNAIYNYVIKQHKTTRPTVLDRLIRLEDSGFLNSRLEKTAYGEPRVQRWTRIYSIAKDSRMGKPNTVKRCSVCGLPVSAHPEPCPRVKPCTPS